jgi:hypothetical protein
MDDETRQQVLQLVTRLDSKITRLEFRVRDLKASADRLGAGIAELAANVDACRRELQVTIGAA